MKKIIQYAIYKGDDFLFMGTKKECAEYFNVKENTILHWATPTYLKHLKDNNNMMIAIRVD